MIMEIALFLSISFKLRQSFKVLYPSFQLYNDIYEFSGNVEINSHLI